MSVIDNEIRQLRALARLIDHVVLLMLRIHPRERCRQAPAKPPRAPWD